MAKAPFGMLCADALSERTLKGALSALQPGRSDTGAIT